MGVYVFKLGVLEQLLAEDAARPDSRHDFGYNIIPRMIELGMKVMAYPFGGYWIDVGTIDAYWEAHMDLLSSPPSLDLNDRSWVIHTRSEERPPRDAVIERAVIDKGVVIGQGARVGECIEGDDLGIVCVGKNSTVPPRFVVRCDAVIGVDLEDGELIKQHPDGVVPAGAYVGFQRLR